MKKVIFIVIMAFFAVMSNAQTAIETPKLTDNIYLGISGGVNTPLTLNSVFPLDATAGVKVGKDFTPVFGANLEGTAWFGSAIDKRFRFDNPFAHNTFRAVNVGLNGTINLTNLFNGYKGTPRTFELETVTGFGWFHTFNPSEYTDDRNGLSAKTALDLGFNLGKKKAHKIYVEPAVFWNLNKNGATNVKFDKRSAWLGLSVGYAYKFKTSNGTHNFKVYDIWAYDNEIARLNAELNKKPQEVVREVVKIVPQTQIVDNDFVVNFSQGSSELTEKAVKTLDLVSSNATVQIIATASPEGTNEINQKLSENRAERVASYLVNRGVNVKSAKGLGCTGSDSQRVAKIFVVQ